MITRGHLIGQIVDDLGSISAQAKQRAQLKLYDVHTYVEDFVKEVLNIVYDLDLRNLNSEKANNPGIDLGDEASGKAFQVTADKSRAKIEDTLGKISEEHRQKYPKVQMIIIGEKQGSYSLDGEPFDQPVSQSMMFWISMISVLLRCHCPSTGLKGSQRTSRKKRGVCESN